MRGILMCNELQRLVNKYDELKKYYKGKRSDFKEETCKIDFINPFFRLLGWDIENTKGLEPHLREVIYEQNLRGTGRSDYTMTLSGVPVYFVEAKKPDVDITTDPEPAFQIRRYGWSANLKISVLTNFEYLIIYDTTIPPVEKDNCDVAILRKYHYKEYNDKYEEIYKLLSRETVYCGNFEKVLIETFGSNEQKGLKLPVDEYFLKQINTWRLQLGNYLYKEKKFPLEIINDVVQRFINQIIFLRICEDRNLPLYHALSKVIEDESILIDEMNKLFKEADKRYNAGLFSGKHIVFDLNSDIIKNIVETLYFPKSPYEFKFIKPNLLGRIYELFLTESLILDGCGNLVLYNKVKRKDRDVNRDIVTTPVEIVKYMVNKSLDELCQNKTPKEIFNLKIADIACGSGIFLIEVFEYLVRYCVNWYKNNDKNHLIVTQDGDFKLPIEDKKMILRSCIFGIDIDAHAVEVTKFNLLLKLLDDETEPSIRNENPALPNIDSNIMLGNSLVDFDIIDYAALSQDDKDVILPFDWSLINNGKKFDLIIGNPPYVNTEDMNNLLPNEELKVYKSKYKTSYQQFDKYFLFIERGLQKIKEQGYLCYIVPNKFTKIKSGMKLRELLARNKYVVEYIDFGSAQLFTDKTIYSSILLLKKSAQSNFRYSEINNLHEWWGNPNKYNSMLISSNVLTETPWVLVPDKGKMEIINKLYLNSQKLKEVADTFNGVQTSAERPPVYWFSEEEIIRETDDYFEIRKFGKQYTIEKSILKRYFKPIGRKEQNLSTYDILTTNKWIIFPYDQSGKLYPINVMKNNFPGTFQYLTDRYDILKPRQIDPTGKRDVPMATPDTWYQYGRDQALTAFNNKPKLIVGVLSRNPMYIYDNNDYVIASGGTAGYCAIGEKEGSPYCLEYIQAYLTHPITEWLISIIGSDFEGGYYSRGTYVLDELPFKSLDFKNDKHVNIYNDVVSKTKRVYEINDILKNSLSSKKIASLFYEKQRLIAEIEGLITYVYSI